MLASDGCSSGVQVSNTILSATLPGRIANVPTLGLGNTPNRFLQEWLDSAPSVVFTPKVLQPLVMFTGTLNLLGYSGRTSLVSVPAFVPFVPFHSCTYFAAA